MKKVKNIINIKNALCVALVAVLGASYVMLDPAADNSQPQVVKTIRRVSVDVPVTDTEDEVFLPDSLPVDAPELTCAGIEFDDGSVLFQDAEYNYAMIDKDKKAIKTIYINDDDGLEVIIDRTDGLSMKRNGEETERVTYNGHTIGLADNVFTYDGSPVKYKDTSFCAYKLTDDYTVECTSPGTYVIRKKDGTVTDSCDVKDDNGLALHIIANDYGFQAIDNDGFIELAVVFNGDVVITAYNDLTVYINGEPLVPPGYDDLYVNPEIAQRKKKEAEAEAKKKAEEETKKKEEEEKKKKEAEARGEEYVPPEEEEEEQLPYSNVSEKPLAPSVPKEYGYVNRYNSELSDYTSQLLTYVNAARVQRGLGELYGLTMLDNVSETRANELKESFSHTRPDGSSYDTALDEAGIAWWRCNENIAVSGSKSSAVLFLAWMSDDECRAAILDPDMKYLSAACVPNGNKGFCWQLMLMIDIYVPA